MKKEVKQKGEMTWDKG